MDDLVRNLLLVLCGLGALIGLIVLYVWNFIFGRSFRAVLMAGLGVLLNRDSTVDLDADVILTKRPDQVKEEMPHEIETLDFQGRVTASDQYVPQIDADTASDFSAQSIDATRNKQEFVSSSFAGGRFRRLTEVISRPFLQMRLTSNSDVPATNVKRGANPADIEE